MGLLTPTAWSKIMRYCSLILAATQISQQPWLYATFGDLMFDDLSTSVKELLVTVDREGETLGVIAALRDYVGGLAICSAIGTRSRVRSRSSSTSLHN